MCEWFGCRPDDICWCEPPLPALPQVNWRGWWAPCGQWERSGAESSGRLYYSVVLPPTVDASPAQSVAIQHLLVNGLYSFPPSATSAGGVPDTLLSGLQCGVTGTFILHSTCQSRPLVFSSSSVLSVMRGVHACRGVSVTLWRCFTAGERHGLSCCMLIFFFSLTEILVACRRQTERSGGCLRGAVLCGAHGVFKSKRGSLVEVDLTSRKQVLHAGERRVCEWGPARDIPGGPLREPPPVWLRQTSTRNDLNV